MRLLRLKLENFRQHESTEVEFERGMTAIVGPNGSGKTTILEAISFALYGETRGKEESIRFYWSENSKYLVRLTFEFGGRRFEAERTHNDASLKEVSEGAKVWATGKRATSDACIKLIGLDHEQFANSFCAEQKSLAFLQFKNNSVRQEEVAKMLGYDRLKLAESLASDKKKSFAERRSAMLSLQADPIMLQTAKAEAQTRVTETGKQLKELNGLIAKVDKEMEPATVAAKQAQEWQEKAQEMKVIAGNADGLKANVSTCESRTAQLKKDSDEFTKLSPIGVEYRALSEQLVAMNLAFAEHLKREQLGQQIADREVELTAAQKRVNDLNVPDVKVVAARLVEALKAHGEADATTKRLLNQWKDDHREAAKLSVATKTDAANLKRVFDRTEELASKGICPECEQPIAKDYAAIVEVKRSEWQLAEAKAKQAAERESRLIEKPKLLVEAETAVIEAQRIHNLAQAADQQAKSLASQASLLAQQSENIAKTLMQLKQQRDAIKVAFDAASKQKAEQRKAELEPVHHRLLQLGSVPGQLVEAEAALKKATTEFEAARTRYRELETQRKTLPFKSAEEVEETITKLRMLQEQRRSAEQDIRHTTQLETAAKRELDQATQRLKEFETIKKDLVKLEKDEAIHAVAASELKALRLNLNRSLGPELEARASENLSLLTNGRYDRISLDKTFAPSLVDDGEVLKTVISGGEEDVVALALRLALSELIQERQGNPLSLLILDEVFGSLDAERRQSVMERLAALKGRFDQILVISHIEDINQVADQCLFLSRNGEKHATQISDVSPHAADMEFAMV